MIEPLNYLRRAPLRRYLESAGAIWSDVGDTAIASSVSATATTADVFMADLSALPRLGFKGRGTIAAMKARGIMVEAEPNRAFAQPTGGLCLVLAPSEVILLGDPLGVNATSELATHDAMLAEWKIEDEERTYPLLRRDSQAWFCVGGPRASEMFSKICAVDLRRHKFANLFIAQTSVAKMSAIVTRADIGGTLAYHLLADSASALYFWRCLTDAAHEFGGQTVGLTALQEFNLHGQTHRSPSESR